MYRRRPGAPGIEISRALAAQNATILGEIDQIRVKRIKVPLPALEQARAVLSQNPHFQFVEYNYLASGAVEPNDTGYSSQWHLPQIDAPAGWDLSVGSTAEPIAVIDSGVDPFHPDLADKLQAGYNFLEGNTDTSDVLGHGTAVAGTAAAITGNGVGVAGIAWDNPIMPLVVLNSNDSATYYNIASAIIYAVDHGVRVMNISIGGKSSSSTLQNAVSYAWNHGALVIACAHNYHTDTPYYPAACAYAVAVSATNESDEKASFSNYGDWIDVAAPGTNIYTTNDGGGYGTWNGTSFSSPIVAGLAALIWSVAPSLTNAQVLAIIIQNADDRGAPGFDVYFGHGRVNVFASLSAALSQYNVYYGHLHNHSNASDGSGTPASAYDYAKNVAGLDFFGLADHASMISSTEWTSIKAAADAYNQDGVFATFWGFEWSSSANWGHIAVVNTFDYCKSTDSATNTFDELMSWLATRDGVAFFNHPGREDDLDREFNHFTSEPSDKFVGIELFNKTDGFSDYYYNDGYYSGDGNKSFYDEALERGWDIGASGSEDNHSGTWGTQTDYRMAVLAEAKTRTAIYNAIKERRFFSTLDKNIALSFELNGQQMGSDVYPGTYDCVIKATDGDLEVFTEIQLIKNGEIIQTWYPNSAFPLIVHQLTTDAGEYYYIKVTQTDGDEAISSPITIVSDGSPDLDPPTPDPMDWSVEPHAIDSSSIGMTAVTAADPSGVEYYFTCVAGGGNDSGWQTSPSYIDSGLSPNTQYTYTVKARDLSAYQNETADSTAASAVTPGVVNTPPYFTSDPIIEVDGVEGASYSSTIADNATDPNPGDTLTFSRVSGPEWLMVATDGTLSGTPGYGDVGLNEWTVHVEDPDGAYDDAVLQIFVNAAGQDIDYSANGESTTRGTTVSGSYEDTQGSDDTYEVISEEIKAGKWSQLDHTWTFDIAGNTLVIFMVEAYHSANSEGDDFVFAYSTDNVVFTEMFTVTKTSDNDTSQSYELPPATSGTVYVRVTDTDNTRGNTGLDTLYVDDMLIRTSGTALEPGAAFNPDPVNGAINVALDTLLTWSAGAGAERHDLYFGTEAEAGNLPLVSSGLTTTSYGPCDLAEGTTYFWKVDEGNSAGTTTGPEWHFTTTGGTCTPSTISVASIVIELLRGSKGQSLGQATVTVLDNCSNPVSGVDVTGHFTGDFSDDPQTATSDHNGQAVFTTAEEIKKPAPFSFIVDGVSAGNLTWMP